MEEAMRRISVVRSRDRYNPTQPIAFSQRRQAERYIEKIVKDKWREVTDLEAIGARYTPRIQQAIRDYGEDHAYVREIKNLMAGDMQQARTIIDGGYRDFRANYAYQWGDLPYIEDVAMYRTVAEMSA